MQPGIVMGDVRVTPSRPRPAESVLIEVLGLDGAPLNERTDASVRIDGVAGARQWVQFAIGGTRRIGVSAVRDGTAEYRVVEIDVMPLREVVLGLTDGATLTPDHHRQLAAADAALPLLQMATAPDAPYRVAFAIGGILAFPTGYPDQPQLLAFNPGAHLGDGAQRAATAHADAGSRPRVAVHSVAAVTSVDVLSVSGTTAARPSMASGRIRAPAGSSPGATRIAKVTSPLPSSVGRVDRYSWDFGDGTSETTLEPRAEHDFRAFLDPDRELHTFDISVAVVRADGSSDTVRRSVSVFNGYATLKRLGVLVPHVEPAVFAATEGIGFRATLRIENVESYPLTLTTRRVRPVSGAIDSADDLLPEVRIDPIVIPGEGAVDISEFVSFADVPKTSMGFVLHYFGTAEGDLPVRVEAYFDIAARDRLSDALTAGDLAVSRGDLAVAVARPGRLIQVLRGAARSAPTMEAELTDLAERPIKTAGSDADKSAAAGPRATLPRTHELRTGRPVGGPVEGDPCDPNNLPELTQEQIDAGWTCQPLPDMWRVETAARFVNAFKGDLVHVPSGGGLVGGLLLQVDPPQRYQHTGMMTRNQDQLTHSTASPERLQDYANGGILVPSLTTGNVEVVRAPTDGFIPSALKYQWPGIVTQSVQEAVYGELMADPDSGKAYQIRMFTPNPRPVMIERNLEIVPPIVVRPDPALETSDLRLRLRNVANAALAETGRAHYRFYCYTDPTLALRAEGTAPPGSGWASGTYPTVCSSFPWLMLKRHGLHLESESPIATPLSLEQGDVEAGVTLGPDVPDGLYTYTAGERLVAAEWLHGFLIGEVQRNILEKAGKRWLADAIEWLTDMADDVANQVVNTFALDQSETAAKESTAWRQTRDANAVSPEDMLRWDSPATGGVYGSSAPIVFRPARVEHVRKYAWTRVTRFGDLVGSVTFRGKAVASAVVQVQDGMTVRTDSAGRYRVRKVPVGSYVVKAWSDHLPVTAPFDGAFASATSPVEIRDRLQQLDLELVQPNDAYRHITIEGRMGTTDSERWVSDQSRNDPVKATLFLDPTTPLGKARFEQRVGGEVRVEVDLSVALLIDRSIHVTGRAELFEGGSEDTTDSEDRRAIDIVVPKDGVEFVVVDLYNSGIGGGDSSRIDLTITNGPC